MTTSIRVPDTISKLSPDDTYPVVQGADVGGFPELQTMVNAHDAKITANIDSITSLTRKGKTFMYSGTTPPVYDPEQHGNYVLTILDGFSGASLTINPPAPVGGMLDGALFTVFNEDTIHPVILTPGTTGSTINGTNGVTIAPENFATFIYQLADGNYQMLESGYIPTSKINLMNYIYHRYQDYLHTFDELKNEGFIEGIKVSGEVAGSATLDITDEINFVNGKVDLVSPGKVNITIDQQAQESTINVNTVGGNYTGVKTLTFSDMTGVNNNGTVTLETTNPVGLEVNGDTGATLSQISKLSFPTSEVASVLGDKVAITPNIRVIKDPAAVGDVGYVDTVKYTSPLTVSILPADPRQAVLGINSDALDSSSGPSLLAYLSNSQEIPASQEVSAGAAWPVNVLQLDSTVYQDSDLVSYDVTTTAVHFRYKAELAENGAMSFLVAARASMHGVAPNAGAVAIYLYDKDHQQVKADISGRPLVFYRTYKQGDRLALIDMTGIINLTEDTDMYIVLEHNFNAPIVLEDRAYDPSGFCAQHLTNKAKTGSALLQYQFDTDMNLRFTAKTFWDNALHFFEALRPFAKVTVGDAVTVPAYSTAHFNDGWVMHTYNAPVIYEIATNGDNISFYSDDVSPEETDYYFGKILTGEDCRMISGKSAAFRIHTAPTTIGTHTIGVLRWESTTVMDPVEPIITNRVGGLDPTFATGWTLIGSVDVATGFTGTVTLPVSIPDDTTGMAFIVYPKTVTAADVSVTIDRMDLEFTPSFTAYTFKTPMLARSKQARWKDTTAELRMDAQNALLIRYTLETNPVPLPVGEIEFGDDIIELDNTVNLPAWTGPAGLGAIQFKSGGVATIDSEVNFYTDEDAGFTANAEVWFSTVTGTGPSAVLTEIPGSRTTFVIHGGAGEKTPQYGTMNEFTLSVQPGTRIAMSGSCDVPGAVFVESFRGTSEIPMLITRIDLQSVTQ